MGSGVVNVDPFTKPINYWLSMNDDSVGKNQHKFVERAILVVVIGLVVLLGLMGPFHCNFYKCIGCFGLSCLYLANKLIHLHILSYQQLLAGLNEGCRVFVFAMRSV